MDITGILIGCFSFIIIGVFHPIIVKGEYYFTSKIWPIFLVAGLVFLGLSIVVKAMLPSSLLGVLGFACLWSIHELKEQTVRVGKGWFPKNPNRESNFKNGQS